MRGLNSVVFSWHVVCLLQIYEKIRIITKKKKNFYLVFTLIVRALCNPLYITFVTGLSRFVGVMHTCSYFVFVLFLLSTKSLTPCFLSLYATLLSCFSYLVFFFSCYLFFLLFIFCFLFCLVFSIVSFLLCLLG